MLRIALFLLIAATMVGALMPSSDKVAAAPADDGIIYTPQSSGSSYRAVGSGHGRSSSSSSSSGSTSSDGALHLDRESDGHFYVDAKVNGAPIRFLVDTGATSIALSADDARRAGFALGAMTEEVGSGASGVVHGQFVSIDSIDVAGKTASDVPAVVLAGGDVSLLGQAVLRRFSISVEGDEMVLR